MNKKYIIIGLVGLMVGLVSGIVGSELAQPPKALGSVMVSGEYRSTTTRAYNGVGIVNLSVLNSNPGTLGSVVITGAGAGVINLYDGTSTVTNLAWPTTTIATIPASAAAGTYTFDLSYYKGLIIEVTGTTPTSTITYR